MRQNSIIIQQFQLKYQQMNKIYDISSDQLKCSFCTQYFKCSWHYANIQRYSLKACHKCLSAFNYTVLHPQTYQLFKVLLFDMGISIPLDNSQPQSKAKGQALQMQIMEAKEDINRQLTKYFQMKINELIKEMANIKEIVSHHFMQIQKIHGDINCLGNSSANMEEIRKKMEEVKQYQINIREQKEKFDVNVVDQNNKRVSHSQNKCKDLSLKSSKKWSFQQQEKQNQPIRSNAAKMIKSKCGLSSSSRMLTSRSKSKLLDRTRINKSIVKSIKLDGYSSRLDQSSLDCQQRYQQRQRSEVNKLLQQKHSFKTYMPCEVIKQSNVCLKSQGNRNLVESVLQLKNKTVMNGMLIELIGGDTSKTNFPCYLKTLKDCAQIKTMRIIRCSLVDADMDNLLHFLSYNSEVQTLIATNNRLTQLSIEALIAFKGRHPQSHLSNVYLGNNYINNLKASAILKRQNINGLQLYL